MITLLQIMVEMFRQRLEIKNKKGFNFSDKPSWNLIEIGMNTNANLFIVPIQDILSLDDTVD